jgi:hypothetical protein
MSVYRDELVALRQRTEALQEQVALREAELQTLADRQGVKAPRARNRGRGRTRPRVVRVSLLSAIVVLPLTCVVLGSPAPDASDPARPGALGVPRSGPRVVSHGAQVGRLPEPPPGDVRLSRCDPKHRYDRPALLPVASRVLDFSQCLGCPCCLPGGNFPRQFTDEPLPKPVPGYDECRKCVTEHVLDQAGVTLEDVGDRGAPHFRLEGRVASITLDKPVVALGLWAGRSGVATGGRSDYRRSEGVTLVGYDGAGRPIDKDSASILAWAEDAGPLVDFQAYREFLVVESCSGATLRRAELYSTDYNWYFEGIALVAAHDD